MSNPYLPRISPNNEPGMNLPGNSEPWMKRGRCTELDPYEVDSIFFVEKGESSNRAKQFCRSCPVHKECGQYALSRPYELEGYWAGTTRLERRRLKTMLGINPVEELIVEVATVFIEVETSSNTSNNYFLGLPETIIENHFGSDWPDD